MNLVILIYMCVSVALLLFDIGFLFYKNFDGRRFFAADRKFVQRVKQELARTGGTLSAPFQEKLRAPLGKTRHLLSLQKLLGEKRLAMDIARDVVLDLQETYKKRSDYEQAYYTYIVSTLDYSENPVPAGFAGEFLAFLDSKSLYTVSNAMNAIYKFGDMNLLLTALDKIDERTGFYHKKLLVDGLLGCTVDKAAFAQKLTERFDTYTPHTQNCILDYLRMAKADVAAFCEGLLDSPDKELRYSAIRFFVTNPQPALNSRFMGMLANDADWVCQMLCIQVLSRYTDADVRALIKSKLTDSNWHVRVNAALYLKKQGVDKQELYQLVCLKDKYADDILLYQFREDEAMTAYLQQIIAQVAELDENAAAEELPAAEGMVLA